MARPTRAQGRPGTRVIPKDWEASHAVVVGKTFTARCRIWPKATAPTINDDLSYDEATAGEPLYEGGCRVQVLNAQEAERLVGDQDTVTVSYLVVVDRDVANVDRTAVVQLTEISDPSFGESRRLVVSKVDRGSLRWERDLYCVDDLTRSAA